MGGGHGHGEGINFKGMTLHAPKRWHSVTGKGMCALMWLVELICYNCRVLDVSLFLFIYFLIVVLLIKSVWILDFVD